MGQMMIKDVVAIIVVSYNRKELLEECICHINRLEHQSWHLHIIDNASTDGTQSYIQKHVDGKKVFYHNTGKNIGGAGGFNYGIKKVVKKGYGYIWLMDDDTMVESDSLSVLIEADNFLNGNYGFLSSEVFWINGKRCNIQRRSLYRHMKFTNEKLLPAKLASFVSFFVPSRVVLDVGLPVKDFFIYGDDWEYSNRISAKYRCFVVMGSRVIHKMQKYYRGWIAKDDATNIYRYYLSFRNDVYAFRQDGFIGWLFIIAKNIRASFYVIILSKDAKLARLKAIWKGFINGLKFFPAIEKIDG